MVTFRAVAVHLGRYALVCEDRPPGAMTVPVCSLILKCERRVTVQID